MERINKWLSIPSFSKLQLIFFCVSVIYLYFTAEYIGFMFQITINFVSFVTYRYRMRSVLNDLTQFVMSDISQERKLFEITHNIKNLCDMYNIEFMKENKDIKNKIKKVKK